MKRTIIIIVIGTLVLVAALWGASRHFGWFSEEIAEPVDTFVYDDTQPIDLKDKTKVYDLIVLDMSGSMDTIRHAVVDGFNTLLDGLKMANAKYSGTQEHYLTLCVFNSMVNGFVYYNAPIDSVQPLSKDMYVPMSKYSVLVTIISDGLENASRFYTKSLISSLVGMQTANGWSFSYFGSGEEMLRAAEAISIDSVHYFEFSDTGMNNVMKLDESSRITVYRAIDSIRRRNM